MGKNEVREASLASSAVSNGSKVIVDLFELVGEVFLSSHTLLSYHINTFACVRSLRFPEYTSAFD